MSATTPNPNHQTNTKQPVAPTVSSFLAPSTSQLDGPTEMISDEEQRKRRELLARRPSYRKILSDLSELEGAVKKEAVENGTDQTHNNQQQQHPVTSSTLSNLGALTTAASSLLAQSSEPAVALTSSLAVSTAFNPATGHMLPAGLGLVNGDHLQQHLNFPSMTNGPNSSLLLPAVSVNQSDLRGLLPMADGINNAAAAGSSPGSFISQDNVVGSYSDSDPSPIPSASSKSDQSNQGQKRQLRLLKNREAAKECRRKKKEYVKCLESRVAVLENQNKALIEELKTLKELYCRKEKGE